MVGSSQAIATFRTAASELRAVISASDDERLRGLRESVDDLLNQLASYESLVPNSRRESFVPGVTELFLESIREKLTHTWNAFTILQDSLASDRFLEDVERGTTNIGRWDSRWKADAFQAQDALIGLLKHVQDSDERSDLLVADLYYGSSLSQAAVGKLMGVSQPTIGTRLFRADARIAQEVLLARLEKVARKEGWVTEHEVAYGEGYLRLRVDLVASKVDGDGQEHRLLIEVKSTGDSEDLAGQLARLFTVQDFVAENDEDQTACLAVYDLNTKTAVLWSVHELSDYFSRYPVEHFPERRTVGAAREHLPIDVSLDALQARKKART